MPDDHHEHHAAFRATRFFGSLDGLRCLSILAVLWHHCLPGGVHEVTLLRRGLHGVDLFFVISGFLITTLLLRERDRTGRISLRGFFMRRTLRIFPLYYTVLLIHVLFVSLFKQETPGGEAFWTNLPYHLTYTSNWTSASGPFSHAWSLATEEQFYLLWPVLLIVLGGTRSVLAIVAFLVAQAFCADIDPGTRGAAAGFALEVVRRVPVTICGGILIAFCLHSRRGYGMARWVCGGRWAPLAAAAAAVALLASDAFPGIGYAIGASLVVLVCSCVVREDHVAAPALSTAPAVSIGRVSYGMYLMHVLVIAGVHRLEMAALPQASVPLFVVVTACTWGVAAVSFRYYESFFLRLKAQFAAPR